MSRFLVTILLLLLSFSFIAQVASVTINSTEQSVFTEEEAKSEKENESNKLESAKDKIFFSYLFLEQRNHQVSSLPAASEYFNISKGFTDRPYTPPDLG